MLALLIIMPSEDLVISIILECGVIPKKVVMTQCKDYDITPLHTHKSKIDMFTFTHHDGGVVCLER